MLWLIKYWVNYGLKALATDGAFSITGHRTGLVARMCADIPTLINAHCIAHREALVARDATRVFLEFQIVLPTNVMSGWAIVQINAIS